jgi:hypothetical protein
LFFHFYCVLDHHGFIGGLLLSGHFGLVAVFETIEERLLDFLLFFEGKKLVQVFFNPFTFLTLVGTHIGVLGKNVLKTLELAGVK